jgi:histidinol-phosphate phosphatase family protein
MRAVFFDRDGTLTADDGGYTHKTDELRFLNGAVDAVKACNDAGALAIVVTNQAGIARGKFSLENMHAFHAAMNVELNKHGARIDAYYFCPYHEEGMLSRFTFANHPDRKPNPGMIRRALIEWNIDPEKVTLFGDCESDMQAARGAGIAGVMIKEGGLLRAVQTVLAGPPARAPAQILEFVVPILRDRASKARTWLFEHALPLWWNNGFDRITNCFFERLSLSGATPVVLPRRVRVQARQTYVYAQAGAMGWSGPWQEAVRAGCKVLIERGMRTDGGTLYALDAT